MFKESEMIDYANLDLSKTTINDILKSISNELVTTSNYNYFLQYGKGIYHLKTIRSEFPIPEEMICIDAPGTQFNFSVLNTENLHTQQYPKGRITDMTDLRPTRKTYIADIVLYLRRPLICIPKNLV